MAQLKLEAVVSRDTQHEKEAVTITINGGLCTAYILEKSNGKTLGAFLDKLVELQEYGYSIKFH